MYVSTVDVQQFMHREGKMGSRSSASVGVKKGAWTAEEDMLLKKCIEKYGEGRWHQVPLRAGLNRCRKSCRLRWLNYLRPNLKRGYFGEDEVDLIMRLHKLLGNRWSLIAGRIPGRTANDVKNYWNSHLKKNPSTTPQQLKKEPCDVNVTKETATLINPQPRTFTKTLNSFMGSDLNIATHDNNKITRLSNDGSQNNRTPPELIPPPMVLDEPIYEYWDSLFDDHQKDIGGQVWRSIGGMQEEEAVLHVAEKKDCQDTWLDFSIDTDTWELLNMEEPSVL